MNNLQQAVIEQLGQTCCVQPLLDTLRDIVHGGIDGGFTGFIYYTDTVAFAERNKDEILELARELAYDLGMDGAYSLVATFGCLGEGYTPDSVADAVNDPEHEDYTQVMNALAWFAAEEVARGICDE